MHSRHLIEASGCPGFYFKYVLEMLAVAPRCYTRSLVQMHHCFYLPLRMELNPFELSDKA